MLEHKIQPQTQTNKSQAISIKRKTQKNRLEKLLEDPKQNELYRRFQEQKPKFKTELARILNEDFNEIEAKNELFKNAKKVRGLLGEISQKPVSKDLLAQDKHQYDPDYIEKMRQKRNLGSKLQKLCYAIPTFKEKLLENLK